jgi:hypothetical protein
MKAPQCPQLNAAIELKLERNGRSLGRNKAWRELNHLTSPTGLLPFALV